MPFEAYIVDGVRTAVGKKKGALATWHPADLGAVVCDALVERTGIKGEIVEDVIFGCVSQIGAQTGNVARNIVLASNKLPESVPGTTVDRQCGSSQQALHFAAQAVMSGVHDVVIAGGVEVMSLVPIGSSAIVGVQNGMGLPYDAKGIIAKYKDDHQFSQFKGGDLVAKKWDITRDELDKSALASHQKAAKAIKEGRFKKEIVPVKTKTADGKEFVFDTDEGVRPETTLAALQKLKTLAPDGRLTAGSASQISDGAAALLIVNERALKKYGLKPKAKVIGMALAGTDPVVMLAGPIPATRSVLAKTGLKLSDMDIYEVNEAFGSVPLAWAKDLKADPAKLNVNGGAMALGHPLGATGAKLMVSLLHELERRGGRYGLQAICEGGGTANATIIERVDAAPKSKL